MYIFVVIEKEAAAPKSDDDDNEPAPVVSHAATASKPSVNDRGKIYTQYILRKLFSKTKT